MNGVTSADNCVIAEGDTVWIRLKEYPKPGVWCVRRMVVDRIKRTGRLVLKPCKGKLGCERMPDQVYGYEEIAKGHSPLKIAE